MEKLTPLHEAFRLVMTRGRLLPPLKPRYRLLAELDNGGFSQVWMARDLRSESQPYVAIKCCQAITTSGAQTPDEVKILRRISGQASSASHRGASNILALIDDFVIPAHDTPASSHQCIVTELVLPLHSWLGELKESWLLMRQLVEAFDFLHASGIVHGDPHEGNIGIAIRDLHKVPEDKMVEHVAEPRKLRTILDNIQDDADIDCDNLLPLTARQVQLKVFDFGRAYEIDTTRKDVRGLPDHELPGTTPTVYRSPEVDLHEMTRAQVGCHWSLGCDVWALGSLLFWMSRSVSFVPIYGEHKTKEYRLAARCRPGGAPPGEWLDYCHLGPSILECLQEMRDSGPSGSVQLTTEELPQSSSPLLQDKDWILTHMEDISRHFWEKKSVKQPWEDSAFMVPEFCQMVRSMMILDDRKRASVAEVMTHPFWNMSGLTSGVEPPSGTS